MQKCSQGTLYFFIDKCFVFPKSYKKSLCFKHLNWKKNIYSRHHKCHIEVHRGKVVNGPLFCIYQTCWEFQISSIKCQFKSAQSWIFSTLLFSKSFISFSIRATLYLSSWNFATGTWNRMLRLENTRQLRNLTRACLRIWNILQCKANLS